MNVLFVATMYTHLANFHQPYIRLLQSWGHEVHCAASSEDGRRDEIEALGTPCWEVPFSRRVFSRSHLRAYLQLKKIIRENQISLIHAHTPVAGFLARMAARRTGVRCLYTAHGFHFFHGAPWLNWLIYYPAEWLAARWTQGLIVINREDWTAAQGLGFQPGINLFMTHGVGVDLTSYPPPAVSAGWRKPALIPAEAPVLSCVADLTPRKNQRYLLQAWREVAAAHPGAYLVLVGEGRSRARLERYVRDHQVPRVRLLGFRRDVAAIMADSQAVVLVSRQEGMPRCLMEAMACARPVIATDVRGSRDLVQNGVNGFLVPLQQTGQLAAALRSILADPRHRLEMGLAGRKMIEDYSLDKVMAEMTLIYQKFCPDEADDDLTGEERLTDE